MKKRHLKTVVDKIIISLGDTKTSARKKAYEVVVVQSAYVAWILNYLMKDFNDDDLLGRRNRANARARFQAILKFLGLSSFESRWYSLRRGGASYPFQQHGSMEKILSTGRWESTKVARIYMNDALASRLYLQLTDKMKNTSTTATVLGARKMKSG